MEFQFNVAQSSDKARSAKVLPDTDSCNEYHAVVQDQTSVEEAQILLELQNTLKTQSLLLEYEQKMKKQKLKEIGYVYTNGFNNYLWEKNRKKAPGSIVIINHKDILQIDEMLPQQFDQFIEAMRAIKMSDIFNIDEKPCEAFLQDFYNFYPRWTTHITDIISMEINHANKIEDAFESEYTFASKVLSSLKFSSTIQMFCNEIFMKPLGEIIMHNEELSLEFNNFYEIWLMRIRSSADKGPYYHLYHYITGQQSYNARHSKQICDEVCQLMGVSFAQAEKFMAELQPFSQNKQAINNLYEQLGTDQIDQAQTNVKLAFLVSKKILENRRKIQSILQAFINEILNSYYIFPKQVKYIMREYYRIAKEKFGEVKHEDVKGFFNKVIYSQLLFPEFMKLMEEQNSLDCNVRNFNIPIIALLSQKILFGQEFYEKDKHSYFNQLISYYSPTIHEFMLNFLDQIHDVQRLTSEKQITPIFISFESIRYLYDKMFEAGVVAELPSLSCKIHKDSSYVVGSSEFKARNVYAIFIDATICNYETVFRPQEKVKRIFLQFLLQIEKIPQPTPLPILLEQYKFSVSPNQHCSAEIHANYLSLITQELNTKQLATQILQDIKETKQMVQRFKITLQIEHNYAQKLESMYMEQLRQRRKFNISNQINEFVCCLMDSSCDFRYAIINGSVCETEDGEVHTLEKCLSDIAEFDNQKLPGTDGLYHMLVEKLHEQVQAQGIVEEQAMAAYKGMIGKKLFELQKLNSASSPQDKVIHEQMLKHGFLNLKLLDLSQYQEEQQLILEVCLPILEQLKVPQSPDALLQHFHDAVLSFQKIILINGKASDITADIQIPMMILILTKSRLTNLQSLLHFIQNFCSEDVNSSIMGQTLTLLKSVTYLIENLGPKQLNMSAEDYQKSVDRQEKRRMAEIDRGYLIINDLDIEHGQ